MLENKGFDIVCVAQPAWSGLYAKSTVLLMKQMAMNNRVLYVDYAYTWKDLFSSIFKKQNIQVLRMLRIEDPIRIAMVKNNKIKLAVLTLPPMLPLNFLPQGWLYKTLHAFNSWVAGSSIRQAIKRIKFQRPVVINAFAPSLGLGLFHKLNERFTVYYCYDEIKEAMWSGKHGGMMEKEFAEKSDAVVVSSDSLCKVKNDLNKNIFVVKNGVDTKLFRPHNDIDPFTKTSKVVGFVGSLDNRIDYDLLSDVIQNSPELQFQFIGRIVDARFKELEKFANVKWIPPVSYSELPQLVQQFDVGLIPFVKSPFTENIYPLKINEYLAMGKPVVMTSFAQLQEFNSIVERADSSAAFKEAILRSLENDDAEKQAKRVAFAQNNSWEARAIRFTKILEQVSDEKK